MHTHDPKPEKQEDERPYGPASNQVAKIAIFTGAIFVMFLIIWGVGELRHFASTSGGDSGASASAQEPQKIFIVDTRPDLVKIERYVVFHLKPGEETEWFVRPTEAPNMVWDATGELETDRYHTGGEFQNKPETGVPMSKDDLMNPVRAIKFRNPTGEPQRGFITLWFFKERAPKHCEPQELAVTASKAPPKTEEKPSAQPAKSDDPTVETSPVGSQDDPSNQNASLPGGVFTYKKYKETTGRRSCGRMSQR
jgi:hypothetical protein